MYSISKYGLAGVVAKAVDLHDVRMFQPGDDLRFRQEAVRESAAVCSPSRSIFKAQTRLSPIWRAL